MTQAIVDVVAAVLARAPEWIRQDLAGKDAASRARAEETLAAMIAAALETGPRDQASSSPDGIPRDHDPSVRIAI
jgi:hypothetical protein